MVGRHLDEDEREAVGVARDQLVEPPRHALRLLVDGNAAGGEVLPRRPEVAHLEKEADRSLGGSPGGDPDTSRRPPPAKNTAARRGPSPHSRKTASPSVSS